MGHFKKALLGAAFAVVATAGFRPAQAVTITSPTSFALVNLGVGNGLGYQSAPVSPGVNGTVITAVGSTTGLYSGTKAPSAAGNDGYTSPFGVGSNQDYYAVQPGGSINFAFTSARTSYGLLFGTIDSYNTLTFTATSATGTQSFTGSDVMNSIGGSPNGSTTRYVLFSGLNPFTSLTVSDTQSSAFEFVPMLVSTTVPEPISISLLGAGLIGMGAIRLRRKA